MSERVFLLGAGFSNAMSPEMPLMDELSRAIRNHLNQESRPLPSAVERFGDDVERWLSYLADSQPWLDEATILRNRAAFVDVSKAIHVVLTERQAAAVRRPQPVWLPALMNYWFRLQSTVITFNYDNLIEVAGIELLGEKTAATHFYRGPITPAALRIAATWGPGKLRGFPLLKLHGSLTWYWSGLSAPPTDPVYDIGIRGGWTLEGVQSPNSDYLPTLVVDKHPMVVPPTATKSGFYNNLILQTQWTQAAAALREARELVIIGYSLPSSDNVVRTLLQTSFEGDVVFAVDHTSKVVDRVRKLFGKERVVSQYAGSKDAIPRFVSATCG